MQIRRKLQKARWNWIETQNPDQARIDLGVAYLENDAPERAREVFAAVNADSEWRDLAELWSLRADEAPRR